MEILPDEIINRIYSFVGKHPLSKLFENAVENIQMGCNILGERTFNEEEFYFYNDFSESEFGECILQLKRNRLRWYKSKKLVFLEQLHREIHYYNHAVRDELLDEEEARAENLPFKRNEKYKSFAIYCFKGFIRGMKYKRGTK